MDADPRDPRFKKLEAENEASVSRILLKS